MDAPFALQFDTFWNWISGHPNCVIRGGSLDAVLYDEEELHWYFTDEADGVKLVQVLRGKRLIGEIFVDPERIDYVQAVPSQVEGEHMFELIAETEGELIAVYFFALVHGYEEERKAPGRVH